MAEISNLIHSLEDIHKFIDGRGINIMFGEFDGSFQIEVGLLSDEIKDLLKEIKRRELAAFSDQQFIDKWFNIFSGLGISFRRLEKGSDYNYFINRVNFAISIFSKAISTSIQRQQDRFLEIRLNKADSLRHEIEMTQSRLRSIIDEFSQNRLTADDMLIRLDEYLKKVESVSVGMSEVNALRVESQKIISDHEKINAAIHYNMSQSNDDLAEKTSLRLYKSFKKEKDNLSKSVYGWLAMLLISIIFGVGFSYINLGNISNAILVSKDSTLSNLYIALQMTAAGGTIWFSWICTKQISQRFRLSQDYGFKAASAEAFVGYKQQMIDLGRQEEFTQLLNITISRLNEDPTRCLDGKNFGSPFHELVENEKFSKIIESILHKLKKEERIIENEKES